MIEGAHNARQIRPMTGQSQVQAECIGRERISPGGGSRLLNEPNEIPPLPRDPIVNQLRRHARVPLQHEPIEPGRRVALRRLCGGIDRDRLNQRRELLALAVATGHVAGVVDAQFVQVPRHLRLTVP